MTWINNVFTDFDLMNRPRLLAGLSEEQVMINGIHAIMRSCGVVRALPSSVDALSDLLKRWIDSVVNMAGVVRRPNIPLSSLTRQHRTALTV